MAVGVMAARGTKKNLNQKPRNPRARAYINDFFRIEAMRYYLTSIAKIDGESPEVREP